MKVTVDASVAVKWFFSEDQRKEARYLLAPRIERYAPDLLLVECANVIWKKARRREIASATPFLDGIAKLSEVIQIQLGTTLLRDATETALRIGHPVYDSLYIACARLTGSVLVTADRRLAKVVSDHVPEVSVIVLQDGAAMANVEEAGIRLVIDRDRVDELSEVWERVDATRESVMDDIHPVPETGVRIIASETSKLAETSPTKLRLVRMIEELTTDERVDLLVLGWIGGGRPHTRRRLFDLAIRNVNNARYIAGYGRHWRQGLRQWSTWDRTVSGS
ncbi:MAG: type II toxin-antitoxin system VapC family toxin [Gemmatimonadetes bacterium]|nr:type II toxin-antitoxin system VapC family toxin [Gemmatimonadota bacterium]